MINPNQVEEVKAVIKARFRASVSTIRPNESGVAAEKIESKIE